MCEILIISMTTKIKLVMIQVDFGRILFHKQNSWHVPESVTSVFCSGGELQLVWGWRKIATALGGVLPNPGAPGRSP